MFHRNLPDPDPDPAVSYSAGQNTAVAVGREEVTGRQERDNSRDVDAVPALLISRQRQITGNKGILWPSRHIIQPVYLFLQQYSKNLFKHFLRRQVRGFLPEVYTGEDLQDEALIV